MTDFNDFAAQAKKLLDQLIAETGEEYHKLHSNKKSFEDADAAMNFYTDRVIAALLALHQAEVERAEKQARIEENESWIRGYKGNRMDALAASDHLLANLYKRMVELHQNHLATLQKEAKP